MMERLGRLQLLQQTVCMQLDRLQLDRLHRLHQRASVQLDRLHQRASVESLQNCLHAKLPAKLSAYSKTALV